MPDVHILMNGLALGEQPRCHGDRLCFSDWGTREVIAIDLDGNSEVPSLDGGALRTAHHVHERQGRVRQLKPKISIWALQPPRAGHDARGGPSVAQRLQAPAPRLL